MGAYAPAAHAKHAVAPPAGEYDPAAQLVHRVPCTASLYVPAPQPRAQKAAVERPLYVRLEAPPPRTSQEPYSAEAMVEDGTSWVMLAYRKQPAPPDTDPPSASPWS